jgi:invasion protein IalB
MSRLVLPFLIAAFAFAAPVHAEATVPEAQGWRTTCDETNARCAEPMIIAFMPLGVALDAGFRAVIDGKSYQAPFQVCYPDGCRAVAPLPPEALAAWLAEPVLSFQFFPFSSDKPIAADVPLAGLKAALAQQLAP